MNKSVEFKFFKVSPSMDLWEHIKEIMELKMENILEEECPSPNYWEFRVIDFNKIPEHLREKIVIGGNYYS